jgi:tetratricopeptide (TPR) repeat protein
VLYDQGEFEAAVDRLIQCSNNHPEDPDAAWEVGILLNHLENFEDAVRWFQLAIDGGGLSAQASVADLSGAARAASAAGHNDLAAAWQAIALERAFHLGRGEWNPTLEKAAASATNAKEIHQWIKSDQQFAELFETSAQYYLRAYDRKNALFSVSVLRSLSPENEVRYLDMHATYLLQMGRIKDGLDLRVQDVSFALAAAMERASPERSTAVDPVALARHVRLPPPPMCAGW